MLHHCTGFKPGFATMQASNSTFQSRSVELSILCHDSSHAGAFERAFDTSAALATGNVTGKGFLDMPLHKYWHKQPSTCVPPHLFAGLQFSLEHGGQASSSFAVTFLYSGIYCLSAVDIRASLLGHAEGRNMVVHGPGKPNVAVYPLYVLVK